MTEPTGLPPEQEAVRGLLADARHDGATPPEVVARLDETLASLVAERRDVPVAPVVDLGARRRRLAGVGLLAAAAVVVAGVAIGQGLPRMQGSGDAGSAAGDAATSEREFGAQEDSAGTDGGGADSQELAPESSRKPGTPAPFGAYPTLASDDADLDEELLDLRSRASVDAQASSPSASVGSLSGCDDRGTGRGRRVLAEVDGLVGVVVFRRADGASQQVDLYVCGDPQAVRTLTLPAAP